MDEKNKDQPATTNNDEGDKPQGLDKIERAEQAVKRMEDAEKRLDDKISRLTELEANRLLGGTAGSHIETMRTPEQVKEAKAKALADEMVKAFR